MIHVTIYLKSGNSLSGELENTTTREMADIFSEQLKDPGLSIFRLVQSDGQTIVPRENIDFVKVIHVQ